MHSLSEVTNDDYELEFKWGRKRGVGGKKKDVQFYDSFTYDGECYTLYDCVYMYKEGEVCPYIGKIIKIWEQSDRSKKIKLQWFFRPTEVSYYLKDVKVLENELFLASGVGQGVANVNFLEAIAGKCSIVCTSTDTRNPQPSADELRTADYVFYRTFDVDNYTISDVFGDLVGGLHVTFAFNRAMGDEPRRVSKTSHGYDEERKKDLKKGSGIVAGKEHMHMVQDQFKKENIITEQMMGDEKSVASDKKFSRVLDEDDPPSKKAKFDVVSSTKNRDMINSQKLTAIGKSSIDLVNTSASYNAKPKVELPRPRKNVEVAENLSPPTSMLSSKTPSSHKEELEGSGKQIRSSGTSLKRPIKEDNDISKTKSSDALLLKDAHPVEGGLAKKAKFDQSFKMVNNAKTNVKKFEEKSQARVEQNSTKPLTLQGDEDTSTFIKGTLNEHLHEKNLLSDKKLSKSLDVASKGDEFKVGGHTFEVTRRPIERSNWIKMPWEEKMKDAHDLGKLVLLQNLCPEYTSADVEDIIWHAFREDCTAKMVQCTATSSPHSGQALIVLKTREAAARVMEKLDQGCLMLPNKMPLIARVGFAPKCFEKSNVFVGHLTLDKSKRQEHRAWKDVVATSHFSQNNTIVFDMGMSWRLLQSKSEIWWQKLYERQAKELKKLTAELKFKATV